MIWANHRLVTGALVFAMTGDVIASGMSVMGSTFPDSIEGHDYASETYNKSHRRSSHWFVPYLCASLTLWALALLPFIFATKPVLGFPLPFTLLKSGAWDRAIVAGLGFIPVGCLCHILEDSICGYVPLWHPRKKVFGHRWFKVRSPQENAFALIVSFLLVFLRAGYFLAKMK